MLPLRFWDKVNKTPSCWMWTGAKSKGYGDFGLNGKTRKAHRLAYEDAKGPIAAGLVIDHLCRTPLCVNPAHMEAVTVKENTIRGVGPTASNARKDACKRGHPLQTNSRGRFCRICKTNWQRQRDKELGGRVRP